MNTNTDTALSKMQALVETVQRRIDACCVAANTPNADYFDASTSLIIATRELLSALLSASKPVRAQPPVADVRAEQSGVGAAQGVSADFKEWFEREWAAHEDKAISGGKIVSMAWALKGYRAATTPQTDGATSEDAYVAKRLSEALADIYMTIIGEDAPEADDGSNAIERVKKAAQVLRFEVDLFRSQTDGATVALTDERSENSKAARGVHALRDVIINLRETGWYRDEEGEDTEALDDLCKLLGCADEPASDAEEGEALRAFDKSVIAGHKFDLESYCAGHIDARHLLAATHAPAMAETQTNAKDAARYRWLRQQRFEFNHSRVTPVRPDKLDSMIDAAIAAASGGEQG